MVLVLLFSLFSQKYLLALLKFGTTAGPFQSDALLVPEHCLFDHIHNQTRCWDFDQWNRTATGACRDRGMRVKSFAMLLPCGIDVFSGVEFVCCPFKPKKGWALHIWCKTCVVWRHWYFLLFCLKFFFLNSFFIIILSVTFTLRSHLFIVLLCCHTFLSQT